MLNHGYLEKAEGAKENKSSGRRIEERRKLAGENT
jgi:hypothetical protein